MSKHKAFLRIVAMLLLGGAAMLALGFVARGGDRTPVRDIAVELDATAGVHFLDKDQLLTQVTTAAGPVIGTPVYRLDEAAMERSLRAIPGIARAEVYHDLDGVLHVKAEQRVPLLRVINADGSGFYIDRNGHTMPLSDVFTARVPVFTGQINEPFARCAPVDLLHLPDSLALSSRSPAMYRLALILHADPLWQALFQQVVTDADGGFELVPSIGLARVRIGNGEQAEQRLRKLRAFYAQGIPQTDWRRYSAIDLRFNDQVVCTKRTF
jgi:cell division protein FtsQ